MPKVSIREIDNTGAELNEYLDYTVLIPGVFLEYYTDDNKTQTEILEGLFTDSEKFINMLNVEFVEKSGPNGEDYQNDIGFVMAYKLLQLGLSVYYYPTYEYITSGESGETETQIKVVNKEGKIITSYVDIFNSFSDKAKYDLRFITLGGLTNILGDSSFTYSLLAEDAIKCAGNRGDAIAVLGLPEVDSFKESEESPEEVVWFDSASSELIDKYIQSTFKSICEKSIERKGTSWTSTRETFGTYAALPNTRFTLNIHDTLHSEGKTITFSGDFDYLLCFARYVKNYREWYAMAGSIRGVCPDSSLIPTNLFGDADNDIFQVRSGNENKGHIASNVIEEVRPYGYVLFGNRTMHPLQAPKNVINGAVQLTASSFLNIRQLICTLKKVLYRAARAHTFEPNSDTLWYNFKNAIIPTLEEMKSNQGIRGYQIVKERTTKKGLLVALIKINPIEAVEDFDLTIELSDSIEFIEE